jgi:hypothetical protein
VTTDSGNATQLFTAEVRIFALGALAVPADRKCDAGSDCAVCRILSQTHGEIVCQPPEGMGAALDLHIAMRPPESQDANTGQWPPPDQTGGYSLTTQNVDPFKISYALPIIYSWTPSPVDGKMHAVRKSIARICVANERRCAHRALSVLLLLLLLLLLLMLLLLRLLLLCARAFLTPCVAVRSYG